MVNGTIGQLALTHSLKLRAMQRVKHVLKLGARAKQPLCSINKDIQKISA